MRIWSLHPSYLDTKGLVALWRESLLAKNVLSGNTKGYKHHPQLNRFKNSNKPIGNINYYLSVIYEEAAQRKYVFDKSKVNWKFRSDALTVTEGQLKYEISHLLRKLELRDIKKYKELKQIKIFKSHPLFVIIPGDIENWEMV